MRVLLIHPPFPYNSNFRKRVLPLGLAYLASYLKNAYKDIYVRILDAHALDLSFTQVLDDIFQGEKWDIIGLSYWTFQAPFAYTLSKKIKLHQPSALLVHGGVHATTCFEEATAYADLVIMHEGEKTLAEVANFLKSGSEFDEINGIVYKRDGRIIKNAERAFIENLDEIPFPAWELLPMERYDYPLHVVGKRRLPIIASRGCPFNCTYCVSPSMWKHRVRWRSPQNVVMEMEKSIREFGIDQFHFWDDNFLLDPSCIEELCREIIKKRLKIRWVALTRTEHINKNYKILNLMKAAGCVGIEIGIESPNVTTLSELKKDQTLADIEKALDHQKQAGFYPLFTLMAFNPGETIVDYYFENAFINSKLYGGKIKRINIGQFATPYPGTPFFKNAATTGTLLSNDWKDYFHYEISYIPDSLLDDIPQKVRNSLRSEDYLLNIYYSIFYRPSFFPKRENFLKKLKKMWRISLWLSFYYCMCSGDKSVREIVRALKQRFNMDSNEEFKFVAFTTILLSQLGMIKSLKRDSGIEVMPQDITLYPLAGKVILGISRLYDRIIRRGNKG